MEVAKRRDEGELWRVKGGGWRVKCGWRVNCVGWREEGNGCNV